MNIYGHKDALYSDLPVCANVKTDQETGLSTVTDGQAGGNDVSRTGCPARVMDISCAVRDWDTHISSALPPPLCGHEVQYCKLISLWVISTLWHRGRSDHFAR